MKKVIALFSLAVLMAGYTSAQESRTQQSPEQEAQSVTDKMVKTLSLTEDQTTLVYRQNLERARQVSKLRSMEASDEQKNKLINDQYQVYKGEIKKILTAEQFATFQREVEANKKEGMKQMRE